MKQAKLNNEDIGAICLSLAQLYHAGIGAGDALALMAEDETAAYQRSLLAAMSQQADEGATLAQIFRAAGCFPSYVCALMEVGEQVGKTEETLSALGHYYEGRARMDRRLKAALLYPVVLLMVMLAVVVILLVWVLPVFNDVYAQLGSGLTGVAGGLLMLGSVLRRAMPVICVILALAAAFVAVMAAAPSARAAFGSAWHRLRGDKGVNLQINTARFAQALSLGLSSGMPAQEAVSMASVLSEDTAGFKKRCDTCLELLDKGESLPAALKEAGLLTRAECRLLEAGVKSGSAENVMEQLAARLLEESESALEARSGRIESVLVVVMSVMVGLILLSVMLPLMNIMTAIG